MGGCTRRTRRLAGPPAAGRQGKRRRDSEVDLDSEIYSEVDSEINSEIDSEIGPGFSLLQQAAPFRTLETPFRVRL